MMLRLVCGLLLLTYALTDSCTFQFGQPVDYATTSKCILSIPFNESWRTQTVQALRSIIPMYAFRDINKNTGPPANIRLDIMKELDRISYASYANDYEFQQDLTTVFNQMRDTHTLYSKPYCYRFMFVQPFFINSYVDQPGQQLLALARTTCNTTALQIFEKQYYALTGFDPSPYYNFVIQKINGQDALPYLKNWALDNVALIDNGTKANLIFGSLKVRGWAQQGVNVYGLPKEGPSITYTLLNPGTGQVKTVTAPWVAVPLLSSRGFNDLVDQCTQGAELKEKEVKGDHGLLYQQKRKKSSDLFFESHLKWSPEMTSADAYFDQISNQHKFQKRELIPLDLSKAQQYGMMFYKIVGMPAAVIKLTEYDQDPFVFAQTVLDWVMQLRNTGINHLIVDVIDNGGGYITNGYKFAALLGGADLGDIRKIANYDEIYSPLMSDLRPWCRSQITENCLTSSDELAIMCNCGWPLDPEGVRKGPMTTYSPATNYTRGGSTSPYTPRVNLDDWAEILNFTKTANSLPNYAPFTPDNLIILTNGFCGSTCAVFVRVLQEARRAKVIGVGGLSGGQISSNVFVGGAVFPLSDSVKGVQQAVRVGFRSPNVPIPLPTNMYFQFTRWEMFMKTNPVTPLQFVPSPTDARINFWPGCEIPFDAYYSVASRYFYCCFPWQDQSKCSRKCETEM